MITSERRVSAFFVFFFVKENRMLCVFGRGHLGMAPEMKLSNATGNYYRVRIGISRFAVKKGGTEPQKESLWCSGLVHEDRIKYQLKNLTKGSSVTFMSNKGWIRQWDDNGKSGAEIDLGFLAMLEVGGKLPPQDHVQATTSAPVEPVEGASGPYAAPTPPAPPQPVWNGKKWVIQQPKAADHPF